MPMPINRRDVLAGCLAATMLPETAPAATWETMPDVEALMQHAVDTGRIGGLAFVAVQDGRSMRMVTKGKASLSLDVPVHDRTLFHVGSVGKHVTAAAILRLVDQARLGIDAPLSRHVAGISDAWGERTVHQVLNHCGGLPDYLAPETGLAPDRPISRERLIDLTHELPVIAPPGQCWSYSNAGYAMLGLVIESVTGQNYADHVATALFAPAGLTESRADDGEGIIPNRAEPYVWANGALRRAPQMSTSVSSIAAGGVLMAPRDIPRWEHALDQRLLWSARTAHSMLSPWTYADGRSAAYAAGWAVDDIGGNRCYWHTGFVPGFHSFHYRRPQERIALMLMATGSVDIAELGFAMVEKITPGSSPQSLSPVEDRHPDWTEAVRALLARTAPPPAMLLAPQIAQMTPEAAHRGLPRLPDAGANAALVLVEDRISGKDRFRRYRLPLPNGSIHIQAGHLPDGRVYLLRRT